MNKVLASAMVVSMALALLLGVVFYGAESPDVAVPMFGFGLLAGVIWAAKLILSPTSTWKYSPMHLPVLGFGIYAFIRYLGSPVEYDARIELLTVALCLLAYFVSCQFYRPSDRTILLIAVLLLVAFESGYALWQMSTKSDLVLSWERPELYRGRGSGTYVCPNNLAGFLELALGIVLMRAFMMHRHNESVEAFTVRRLGVFYIALMALVGIGVTLSRGGWVAALAGLAMLALWGDWRSRVHWGRFAAVCVVVLGLGLVAWKMAPARVLKAFTAVDQNGTVSLGLGDRTLNSRLLLWSATMKIIGAHPIVGTGPGSWQWVHLKLKSSDVPTHPEYTHNDYLNLFSDYGAIGFLLMLWVFVGFFRQAWKLGDPRLPSEARSWAAGAVVGVTALLVHSFLDFNLHIPANALALSVVLGSVAAMTDPEERFARTPMAGWARQALGVGLMAVCGFVAWQFSKAALGARYTRMGNDAKFLYVLYPEVARGYYSRAIHADPGFPTPHWKTADTLRTQAQWRIGEEKKSERVDLARQAIPFYAAALRLNPYQTEVLLKAAAADMLAGDDEAARQKYIRAVDMEPNSPVAPAMLGKFYRDRGQRELAEKYFTLAQKLKRVSSSGIDWSATELQENREF